jgi:hypothetical protein
VRHDITVAIGAAIARTALSGNPGPDLERWNLHQYIEVAAQLGIINPNTAMQTRLAKDFRNFIHPGVAQRLNEKCDRATALSARYQLAAEIEILPNDINHDSRNA